MESYTALHLTERKRGNAKIPSWETTVLGHLRISGRSLVAEVNSENRAQRLRAEIEKRLGASAIHLGTTAQAADERRIEWTREEYGIHDAQRPPVLNAGLLLSGQRKFANSANSLGLQLADMLASILRRALNNCLQPSG